MLCCCFNWRISYFWFLFLYSKTLFLILFYCHFLKEKNCKCRFAASHATTHQLQEYAQNYEATTFAVIPQRCIRNFFKFPIVHFLWLNFSWKNLPKRPATKSSFFLCQHYEVKRSWKAVTVKVWMEADVWKRFTLLYTFSPGMRRRSDVSFRSHIGRDVADHAETLSWRRNWYMNETDLFKTSMWCLIST